MDLRKSVPGHSKCVNLRFEEASTSAASKKADTSSTRCSYNLDWTPVAETAVRFGGSSEFVQEILVANAKVTGGTLKSVPATSTITRSVKKAILNRRDASLSRIRSNKFCIQFDGKENYEVYLMNHLAPDGKCNSLPLEVLKSKKALTGKQLAIQMKEKLPIEPKDVLAICSDTTAVNSGTGKVGGACYWYQELTDSICFVIMCRLHSLECLSGIALKQWNLDVFGSTPKCEHGPSGTVRSIETLCFNLRELSSKYFNLWTLMDQSLIFEWPSDYEPFNFDHTEYFTDVQKLFCMLVSKRQFTMSDIGKSFCAVGVRWLGFLTSMLHSSLTYEKLRQTLSAIPDSDVPNKTVKNLIENTIFCLDKVNLDSKDVVKKIYDFSVIYWGCWRDAVMSNGTNILEVSKINVFYKLCLEMKLILYILML